MDDIRFKHFSPIVTGTPGAGQGLYPPTTSTPKNTPTVSFADVLRETIEKNSEVNFSNHAIKRAVDHNEPELVIALIEHNMAVSYKKLGEFTEAATHCEKALRIREKNLAAGVSYDLAMSKSVLGQIYVEIGNPNLMQEAESLLCEAVLSLKKIVGEEHIEYEKALTILKSFFKKDLANNII